MGTAVASAERRPGWQRGRVVQSLVPSRIGAEVWVRVPPFSCAPISLITGRRLPLGPCYEPNFTGPQGQPLAMPTRSVELIGRGPEDFADDVPTEPWPW